jgi:type IV pilus assembly protein PilV
MLMKMKPTHQGFTLIEVLVAMLVLSIGLLGIASTLIAALHSSTSNYLQQQAVQSAYDIVERMRSNFISGSIAGSGNPYIVAATAPSGTAPAPNCASVTTCTSAQMAAYDVWEWQTQVKNSLPGGVGQIAVTSVNASAQVVITLTWSDQPAQATFNPTGSTTATYTVVTEL